MTRSEKLDKILYALLFIDKIKNQNELILTKTIEKFRYDKIALGVAIISLIVAIIALIF